MCMQVHMYISQVHYAGLGLVFATISISLLIKSHSGHHSSTNWTMHMHESNDSKELSHLL